MQLLLFAIAILAPWFVLKGKHDQHYLMRLQQLLFHFAITSRKNNLDPLKDICLEDSQTFTTLSTVLRIARRQGFMISDSLEALRRHVDASLKQTREQKRLLQLFCTRLSLSIGVATVLRILLSQMFPMADTNPWDLYRLIIVVIFSIILPYTFRRALPKNWIWSQTLRPEVSQWFYSYISGIAQPLAEKEIKQLCHRELREGISLKTEKRKILENWAEKQLEDEKQRLNVCLEWLPLIELIGFGVISSLILAKPGIYGLNQILINKEQISLESEMQNISPQDTQRTKKTSTFLK